MFSNNFPTAEMPLKLTEGALSIVLDGRRVDRLIVQILGLRKIESHKDSKGLHRFRLLISDGKYMNKFVVLESHLNGRVTSKEICMYTVVEITRHKIATITKGDKIAMVVSDLKVLAIGTQVGFQIGNPQPITQTRSLANQVSSIPNTSQNECMPAIRPVAQLRPRQNTRAIKVRVILKSEIRYWSNDRGKGNFFTMLLMDRSGQICAKAFNQQCDKFYDTLQVNNVYIIVGFEVEKANKDYTKDDYELKFKYDTEIQVCNVDCADFPSITYNFTSISDLETLEDKASVDVIGVCKTYGDVTTVFTRRDHKELKKRDVTIVDESNTAVNVTLWRTQAEEFDGSENPVMAIKNGIINEFRGTKSISINPASIVTVNPDTVEAHRVRQWFDEVGVSQRQINISGHSATSGSSPLMKLSEAKHLASRGELDRFSCVATVLFWDAENVLYKSCPAINCSKKVTDLENGKFNCEKCDREYSDFKYRLCVRGSLVDATDYLSVTCFQDIAQKVLGITSDELVDTVPDQVKFQDIFLGAAFKKYLFELNTRIEPYNGNDMLKATVKNVQPVPWKEHNASLISEIKEMVGIENSASGE